MSVDEHRAFFDEIDVEMVPAEDPYPDGGPIEEADDALLCEFAPDELEGSRGVQLLHYGLDSYLPEGTETLLKKDEEPEEPEHIKKTKLFMESIKIDGAWARSLNNVELCTENNHFLKKNLKNLLIHCIKNVNNRPKYMEIKTKCIGLQDIQDVVKMAFTHDEPLKALNNSMCRLYCKNAGKSLKELVRHLFTTCREIPNLRLTTNDIFAEYKPSKSVKIRMKTRDINSFLNLEEHARHMKVEYQTTLSIKRRNDPSREINISWFDRYSDRHGQVSFVHMDHTATCTAPGRVSIGGTCTEEHEIPPGSKFIPLSATYPSIQDLITFLNRTSVGTRSL